MNGTNKDLMNSYSSKAGKSSVNNIDISTFLTQPPQGQDSLSGSKIDLDLTMRSIRKAAAEERKRKEYGIDHWDRRDLYLNSVKSVENPDMVYNDTLGPAKSQFMARLNNQIASNKGFPELNQTQQSSYRSQHPSLETNEYKDTSFVSLNQKAQNLALQVARIPTFQKEAADAADFGLDLDVFLN